MVMRSSLASFPIFRNQLSRSSVKFASIQKHLAVGGAAQLRKSGKPSRIRSGKCANGINKCADGIKKERIG